MWLAYPAFVIVALAMVNFGLVFVQRPTPVPVYVSHPLGMLAGASLMFVFVLPSSVSGRLGIGRVLPPPGPGIATGKCGGRLGRMTVSGRLITVTVYADRLTLRIFPMGEFTIHGSDIDSVEGATASGGGECPLCTAPPAGRRR